MAAKRGGERADWGKFQGVSKKRYVDIPGKVTGLPRTSKHHSAKSLLRYSRRRYSECIRQGMRVASAFQAVRLKYNH